MMMGECACTLHTNHSNYWTANQPAVLEIPRIGRLLRVIFDLRHKSPVEVNFVFVAMSLITSHKRKKKDVGEGGKGGPQTKKKKDKVKEKVPEPVEGGPFLPGQRLFYKYRGRLRPCEIVERRLVNKRLGKSYPRLLPVVPKAPRKISRRAKVDADADRRWRGNAHPKKHPYKYYVHYLEYNRRMDQWVPLRAEIVTRKGISRHRRRSK